MKVCKFLKQARVSKKLPQEVQDWISTQISSRTVLFRVLNGKQQRPNGIVQRIFFCSPIFDLDDPDAEVADMLEERKFVEFLRSVDLRLFSHLWNKSGEEYYCGRFFQGIGAPDEQAIIQTLPAGPISAFVSPNKLADCKKAKLIRFLGSEAVPHMHLVCASQLHGAFDFQMLPGCRDFPDRVEVLFTLTLNLDGASFSDARHLVDVLS